MSKTYDEVAWEILENQILPPKFLEQHFKILTPQQASHLAQCLLLTNFEGAISGVSSSCYIEILPSLVEISRSQDTIFSPTRFSNRIEKLLRYDYFDFIFADKLAEITKVHFVQKYIVLLCLSEKHYSGFTVKVRGPVSVAMRLLAYLKFNLRVLSKIKLVQMSKRAERLNHINQLLSGLEKNTSRMREDDGKFYFNY